MYCTSQSSNMNNHVPTYSSLKMLLSRVHKKMSIRRKKDSKPRLVISAPFNFKKEDTMCFLKGISSEELCVMREKAVASIVGSATTSPYPDSPPHPSLLSHGSELGYRLKRSGTNNSANTVTTAASGMARGPVLTSSRTFGQPDFQQRHHHFHPGALTFHPLVLASTEPYLPIGLSTPPSSSASSINSCKRDRD